MAPKAAAATPKKGGPQRSIQSFFTKSPAKALVESTPAKASSPPGGKKKVTLTIGAEQQQVEKKIEATPGKRKVEHEETKKQEVEVEVEETPVKRRRLRKISENSDSNPECKIGRRLKVYWPLDKAWYEGRVTGYNASEEKHVVLYDDGEQEDVDVVLETVEWLSECDNVKTGSRPKRGRNEAAKSAKEDSETGDEPDPPRRGRTRRKMKSVAESDDDDDDDDDDDFHVAQDESEDKESEVDDEEDDDPDEPVEEESDSDEKPRKRAKKTPSSAVKKPSARGAKKLSKPASAAGVLKGASVAKKLSGSARVNSGSLNTFLGVSNDLPSNDQSTLTGEAAERFGGRDSEKFKFLGKDRKDAAGKKPTDPAYNPCTVHLPADFVKGLSGGQRQWWMFKAKHMDKVLLFKMGKFYEILKWMHILARRS